MSEGCGCSSMGGEAESQCSDVVEESTGYNLSHWPIQIKLMGTAIPFLEDADLMVAADCTGFAVQDFHNSFLKDKKLLIGCPKLDDAQFYVEKFTEIFKNTSVKNLTALIMQVPCCGGMSFVLKEAIKKSGKNIPMKEIVVGVKGEILRERDINIDEEE